MFKTLTMGLALLVVAYVDVTFLLHESSWLSEPEPLFRMGFKSLVVSNLMVAMMLIDYKADRIISLISENQK